MKRSPVPETAVRSAEDILKGLLLTHEGNFVWTPCWNCGGTGNYPSSMSPPGQCRLYCWAQRTGDPFTPVRSKSHDDPTFGLLPTSVDTFVKKAQASDRAAYRAQERAAKQAAEQAVRLTAVDPRIATLAMAFGLDVGNLADADHDDWQTLSAADRNRDLAVSLVGQWVGKGELSAKQWTLVSALPSRETDRQARQAAYEAERAARQYLGQVGDRLTVTGTVQRVSSFQSPRYRGYGMDTRYAVRLLTTDGYVVSWFADGSPVQLDRDGRLVEQAPTLTVTGTVKKHDEYKGEKQTVLQRVKVSV